MAEDLIDDPQFQTGVRDGKSLGHAMHNREAYAACHELSNLSFEYWAGRLHGFILGWQEWKAAIAHRQAHTGNSVQSTNELWQRMQEIPEDRDEWWRETVREMARAEYGRSWKKTTDERWLEVAQIAAEAVRNAYTLDDQRQAAAALLYMETINALKAERGRANGN